MMTKFVFLQKQQFFGWGKNKGRFLNMKCILKQSFQKKKIKNEAFSTLTQSNTLNTKRIIINIGI